MTDGSSAEDPAFVIRLSHVYRNIFYHMIVSVTTAKMCGIYLDTDASTLLRNPKLGLLKFELLTDETTLFKDIPTKRKELLILPRPARFNTKEQATSCSRNKL